jgi:hypothetical protein
MPTQKAISGEMVIHLLIIIRQTKNEIPNGIINEKI